MSADTGALILFALLQVADIFTTWKVLSQGGRELNPVMAWVMGRLGVLPGLVLAKLALLGLLVSCPPNLMVMAGLCVLYAAVVVRNWRLIK